MTPEGGHKIERVNFRGQELWAAIGHDPKTTFVAVPPICRHLGISARAQRSRIQGHPVLVERSATFDLPSGRGSQTTLCIRLDALNLWLAMIQPDKRRRPEQNALLVEYQRECADVLFAHFFGRGHAVLPDDVVQVVPLLREIKRGVDAIESKQDEHNRDTEERELLQDTRLDIVQENQHLAAIRAQEDRERDVAAQAQQAQMAGNVLSIRDVQDQVIAPTVKQTGFDAEETLDRQRDHDARQAEIRSAQSKRFPRKVKGPWRGFSFVPRQPRLPGTGT
jgi:hypothetical protein